MKHDFEASLAASQAQEDAPFWGAVYRKAFSNLEATISVREDGWAQRAGIDRMLVLADGTTLTVDEKVREKAWPDFCLEYWSDRDRKARGWVAKDLTCDYIAYAFVPTQTCYLLPFQLLRRAWRANGAAWVSSYPKIEARNEDPKSGRHWTTVSVAVPIASVVDALKSAMIVRWSA